MGPPYPLITSFLREHEGRFSGAPREAAGGGIA